jgi:hypothetical protein
LFPLSNLIREGEIKGVSKNEKERDDVYYYYYSPSLTLLERGNKKGVSKKREGRYESCFIQLFPLSNSIREGE